LPSIKNIYILFFISFLPFCNVFSQNVSIVGKVYDRDNPQALLNKLMVINKRTNMGIFANADGTFKISAEQSDTILFSALGYLQKKICLADSAPKKNFYVDVALSKLYFTLKEVSIFPVKSLNEIQKEIDKLGVKSTYMTNGLADAVSSPISYLYERFSKFERSKRQVAEWENEELKRDVLKDLFRVYVKYDVIDLSDEEFDAFIKYLNLSEEFIQNATQFELVMAIKGKYENFKYSWR